MYPALENNISVYAAAAAHKGLRYHLVSPYMLLCLAGTATKSLPAPDLRTLCTVTQTHPSTLCSRLFFPPVSTWLCVFFCLSTISLHPVLCSQSSGGSSTLLRVPLLQCLNWSRVTAAQTRFMLSLPPLTSFGFT